MNADEFKSKIINNIDFIINVYQHIIDINKFKNDNNYNMKILEDKHLNLPNIDRTRFIIKHLSKAFGFKNNDLIISKNELETLVQNQVNTGKNVGNSKLLKEYYYYFNDSERNRDFFYYKKDIQSINDLSKQMLFIALQRKLQILLDKLKSIPMQNFAPIFTDNEFKQAIDINWNAINSKEYRPLLKKYGLITNNKNHKSFIAKGFATTLKKYFLLFIAFTISVFLIILIFRAM
ncbi:hypothetical protein [Apilactobacillus timberlakei]|uniref:hypothetical protein n=1 Tax=Apilactobacillus timberlakei TaxID=2008380 RepID=UPI00112E4CA6|nr:hypothetical protein [Apilactobacillus timberlakei]TPR16707.1 hypothetical protein DYZ95_06935 [Apilactobacillus timberlakei]